MYTKHQTITKLNYNTNLHTIHKLLQNRSEVVVVLFSAACVGEEQFGTCMKPLLTIGALDHIYLASCNYNILLGWDCPLSLSHSAFSLTLET